MKFTLSWLKDHLETSATLAEIKAKLARTHLIPLPSGEGQGGGEDACVMANEVARSLRKRQTIAETALWEELQELRRQGYHFRKQAPLHGHVVDLACLAHRLVIEANGAQHLEPEHQAKDQDRDDQLRWRGFNSLRYSNADVMENRDVVALEIRSALGAIV